MHCLKYYGDYYYHMLLDQKSTTIYSPTLTRIHYHSLPVANIMNPIVPASSNIPTTNDEALSAHATPGTVLAIVLSMVALLILMFAGAYLLAHYVK